MKSYSNVRLMVGVLGGLMVTTGIAQAHSPWKTIAHLTSVRFPTGPNNLIQKNFQINPSQCEYRLGYRYTQPAPCFSSTCSSPSSIGTAVLNSHHVRADQLGGAILTFLVSPNVSGGTVTGGTVTGVMGTSGTGTSGTGTSGTGTGIFGGLGGVSGPAPGPGSGPSTPSFALSELSIQLTPELHNKYRVFISPGSAGLMPKPVSGGGINQSISRSLGAFLGPQVLGVRLEQRCDESSPNDGVIGPMNSSSTSSK